MFRTRVRVINGLSTPWFKQDPSTIPHLVRALGHNRNSISLQSTLTSIALIESGSSESVHNGPYMFFITSTSLVVFPFIRSKAVVISFVMFPVGSVSSLPELKTKLLVEKVVQLPQTLPLGPLLLGLGRKESIGMFGA